MSPNGCILATASYSTHLYDMRTNTWKMHLKQSGLIEKIKWSPNGEKLCSISYNQPAKVLDANTGACVKTFQKEGTYVSDLIYSMDSHSLVSVFGSHDGTLGLCVFDPQKGPVRTKGYIKTLFLFSSLVIIYLRQYQKTAQYGFGMQAPEPTNLRSKMMRI